MSRDMKLRSDADDHLEDVVEGEVDFKGATLAISSDTDGGMASSREDLSSAADDRTVDPSVLKASSARTSSVDPTTPDDPSKDFFAVRAGAFDHAVETSKPVILEKIDGKLLGAWLLTEIDHWDTEKERLLLLTSNSLLVIKYDFITLLVMEYKRLSFQDFDKVVIGNFTYPQASVVPRVDKLVSFVKGIVWNKFHKHPEPTPPATSNVLCVGATRHRHTTGIRIMWNKGKPIQLTDSWNPWSKNIPFVTFTSHPLASHLEGNDVCNYQVENFTKILLQAIDDCSGAEMCVSEERPIIIENYLGLAAFFHNVNNLGFFKARGKVSF